ncbi:MAG: hypothetical protein KBT51_08855 [Cycloclasticus sp.]|nr:hypothetical protein [Cycloclasticus sp.]
MTDKQRVTEVIEGQNQVNFYSFEGYRVLSIQFDSSIDPVQLLGMYLKEVIDSDFDIANLELLNVTQSPPKSLLTN